MQCILSPTDLWVFPLVPTRVFQRYCGKYLPSHIMGSIVWTPITPKVQLFSFLSLVSTFLRHVIIRITRSFQSDRLYFNGEQQHLLCGTSGQGSHYRWAGRSNKAEGIKLGLWSVACFWALPKCQRVFVLLSTEPRHVTRPALVTGLEKHCTIVAIGKGDRVQSGCFLQIRNSTIVCFNGFFCLSSCEDLEVNGWLCS